MLQSSPQQRGSKPVVALLMQRFVVQQPNSPQHTWPLGQHAGGSNGRVGMMQGSHRDLATSGRITLRRTTHAVLLGFDVDSCGQGLQKAMPTWPPLLYHPTGHREHVLMSALLP